MCDTHSGVSVGQDSRVGGRRARGPEGHSSCSRALEQGWDPWRAEVNGSAVWGLRPCAHEVPSSACRIGLS